MTPRSKPTRESHLVWLRLSGLWARFESHDDLRVDGSCDEACDGFGREARDRCVVHRDEAIVFEDLAASLCGEAGEEAIDVVLRWSVG